MTTLGWVLVGPAGALGALARYGTGRAMSRALALGAPWGVLVVNLLGAFLLGLVVGARPGDTALVAMGTGFLGAFTTFSAWMIETDDIARGGRYADALLNVVGPLIAGLLLAAAGLAAGSALG
jgi:fluoride exporter